VCFSNSSVGLHVVMMHRTALLILGIVKTSDLTKCVCVVHIVVGIFGFRIVTKVGLNCNSLSGRVFTCTCKLVRIDVPLLAACLGAVCWSQLSHCV